MKSSAYPERRTSVPQTQMSEKLKLAENNKTRVSFETQIIIRVRSQRERKFVKVTFITLSVRSGLELKLGKVPKLW